MTGPTPVTTLSWLDADIVVDASGALTVGRDQMTYLTGWRPTQLVRGAGGRTVEPLATPAVQTLPDEVELSWTLPSPAGELVVSGRHSFSAIWSQRWVIRNHRSVAVGPVTLPMAVGVPDAAVCWVFGAGVESSLSVQPFDPDLPVLGMAVQHGGLRHRPDGVDLGPCELAPGEAYVVELRASFFDDAAAFGRTVHGWLPPSTYLQSGEVVVISHPDAALDDSDVPPSDDPLPPADQLMASVQPDESEFVDGSDGERLLTFHDARGRTDLVLHWAKPLDRAIAEAAGTALAGDRIGNGTPRLPDVQAGLLVQRALADHAELDPDVAADALDLLAARTGEVTPWQVIFDCAEYHRTGEDDQLIRAHGTFLRNEPCAGMGLAASRLVVALLSVGRDPVPILQRLEAARDQVRDEDVRLELTLVAGTVFGAGHAPHAAAVSARRLAQVVARLGSGLRGASVPDLPPVDRARLLTLLSLLPELAGIWQDRMAVRPGPLVQYAANRVLYDVEVGSRWTAQDRQALVWLTLSSDT